METRVVALGTVETRLGTFGAVVSEEGLCRLTLPGQPLDLCVSWICQWMPEARPVKEPAHLKKVEDELNAYLEGQLRSFTIPVCLRGTPFQLRVWQALQSIPYGEVRTYAQVAATVGRPQAVRAVGAANSANPVPIFVPCHRVTGSKGQLVGYSGGLEMKRELLRLEEIGSRCLLPSGTSS